MTSFRRTLFGYRKPEVDAAVAARDSHISGLEQQAAALGEAKAALESQSLIQARAIASNEADLTSLSGMVIERERTIRDLTERLEEANACHDRSIASLDKVTARLEELQAQARGQATRIRMKALSEAVEVSRRVQALTEAEPAVFDGLFEGEVKLEIGPLGDFSQLVGFEDTVGRLGASEISVERFSEGRATFSMRLEQPVELLRELEDLSALDFKVRHNAPDNLILDIDEDQGPEQRAA
jgi:hypothetical protein